MRALILAAGMGTRLRPLTNTIPKTMVPVLGEPMIVRQIRFLREIGVDEITVVTGYRADRLAHLEDEYGVRLIHNDKYEACNNLYSMYLARDFLSEMYVLEGDVFLTRNFLAPRPRGSTYFAGYRANFRKEWILKLDDRDRVREIIVGDGSDYIMSGVSYWTEEDARKIKALVERAVGSPGFESLVWDDLIKDNLKLFEVSVRKIAPDDWFEIDSVADLKAVEEYLVKQGI